jgi:hypothetical protein
LYGPFSSVPAVNRALGLIVVAALAGALTSCGAEESDLLTEDSVRECLADHGMGAEPREAEASGPPVYLSTAPDFSAYSRDGTRVDVVVQGTAAKAERTAADVRGAMLPLGISDANQRVVTKQNVVAVFADSPSREEREAVSACLG